MRVFLIFTVVAVGTYLVRVSGIALLSNPEKLSPRVRRALGLVAPTAMGAIIVNSLFLDEDGWREFGAWHLGAAVAIAVALWKRSSGWAMSLGAAAFALLLLAGM
ncbi:AzlD domain-containing protein [Demequina sp.]|uniref:AzlD domain-containing protein n=1 Tax=Demequina sp. TaxID=2050685 RepID=UPI0025B7E9BD|nr:AzlD domain-containing protein [Demequina sp.]